MRDDRPTRTLPISILSFCTTKLIIWFGVYKHGYMYHTALIRSSELLLLDFKDLSYENELTFANIHGLSVQRLDRYHLGFQVVDSGIPQLQRLASGSNLSRGCVK